MYKCTYVYYKDSTQIAQTYLQYIYSTYQYSAHTK